MEQNTGTLYSVNASRTNGAMLNFWGQKYRKTTKKLKQIAYLNVPKNSKLSPFKFQTVSMRA